MSTIDDQAYLRAEQYHNADKLNDRIQLHERFSTNSYPWQRWVFDQIEIGPQSRLLEVGCGPGKLWLENADRIPAGWDVTLADFSAGMLGEARHSLAALPGSFTFEVADIQALPFEDASFDAVIANHMLYHVPDRPKALAEVARVLRPDERFFAATNGQSHLRELHELERRFDPHTSSWGGRPSMDFTLENGMDQLALWFEQIELRRYENGLLVTEAAPLVAFMLSMHSKPSDPQRRAALHQFVERELQAAGGALPITKATGIFIAKSAEGRQI